MTSRLVRYWLGCCWKRITGISSKNAMGFVIKGLFVMKKIINNIFLPLLSIVLLTILFQWKNNESIFKSVSVSIFVTLIIMFLPKIPINRNK
jgi:hypothetical protein